MAVTTEMIKELREKTGAGILDCKRTLDATDGDIEKAAEILKEKGMASAQKKAGREASDGRIEVYEHPGNKLVAMIEINCETDFVARTDTFLGLCHDLAMHVAAAAPQWVSRDDVPVETLAEEKAKYADDVAGKPEHIVGRIIDGKLAKFYEENCLLEQTFIRDEEKTVQQLITESVAKLGENIMVKRFARFQIG